MLNQDAIQILPPRPPIPTKPTTSCIKPSFKEKEKKGYIVKKVPFLGQGCIFTWLYPHTSYICK